MGLIPVNNYDWRRPLSVSGCWSWELYHISTMGNYRPKFNPHNHPVECYFCVGMSPSIHILRDLSMDLPVIIEMLWQPRENVSGTLMLALHAYLLQAPGAVHEPCFDQGLRLQDLGIHFVHHDKLSLSRFTEFHTVLCLMVFFLVSTKLLG